MIDCGEPTVVTGLSIEPSGKITFHGTDGPIVPVRAWQQMFREREKSPKTIVQIPADVLNLSIKDNDPLFRFDDIFVCDTNSKELDGTLVSVANLAQFKTADDKSGGLLASIGTIEFHNVAQHQENLAWSMLVRAITTSRSYSADRTYAIVTDSDLGNHNAFNNREKPIYGDAFLPGNFQIVYASDEGQALCNHLIRHSDKLARQKLNAILSGQSEPAKAVAGRPFTHLRIVANALPDGWLKLESDEFALAVQG